MSAGWERIRLRVETGESLQPEMPKDTRTLSTHVLDTHLGKPAPEVPINVYRLTDTQEWQELKRALTDTDGRAGQLVETNDFQGGIYKLKFDVQKYYIGLKTECFYPFIEIVVQCKAAQHYHIPLLLSPFGYTTYKGTNFVVNQQYKKTVGSSLDNIPNYFRKWRKRHFRKFI